MHHAGVGADNGELLRLWVGLAGGAVFGNGEAQHIVVRSFVGARGFVDFGGDVADGVAQILQDFAAARAVGGEIELRHGVSLWRAVLRGAGSLKTLLEARFSFAETRFACFQAALFLFRLARIHSIAMGTTEKTTMPITSAPKLFLINGTLPKA